MAYRINEYLAGRLETRRAEDELLAKGLDDVRRLVEAHRSDAANQHALVLVGQPPSVVQDGKALVEGCTAIEADERMVLLVARDKDDARGVGVHAGGVRHGDSLVVGRVQTTFHKERANAPHEVTKLYHTTAVGSIAGAPSYQ